MTDEKLIWHTCSGLFQYEARYQQGIVMLSMIDPDGIYPGQRIALQVSDMREIIAAVEDDIG